MKFVQLFSHRDYKTRLTACVAFSCLVLFVSGCTSSKAIRTPVLDSPTVEQAISNRDTAKLIRWGGMIVSVENKADHTLIEIVDRPLTRNGTPKVTNESNGRFIAKSDQFIDPENINTSQTITVSGTIIDYTTRMIGDYEYVYPVVEIREFKIWPQDNRRDDRGYYYPYWYDPYWGHDPYWYNDFRYRHRYRYW